MRITRHMVAEKLAAYLRGDVPCAELVDWAENAMMDGDFTARDVPGVRDVVARLGVADVRAFGLTWEDCQDMLRTLGYKTRVAVVAGR